MIAVGGSVVGDGVVGVVRFDVVVPLRWRDGTGGMAEHVTTMAKHRSSCSPQSVSVCRNGCDR